MKREYFYNAFSLELLKYRTIDGDHSRICSPPFARMVATIHADGRHQSHMNPCKIGKTHYEIALKRYLNDLCFSRLSSRKCLISTQISQCLRLARPRNLTDCASLRPRLSALPPTRMSVSCDERNFSSSEECSLLLNSAGWQTRV